MIIEPSFSTCQIRYESSVAVYMHYKRKPTGEIMRTDDNSQKFWDKLGSNISGFMGIDFDCLPTSCVDCLKAAVSISP